MDELEGITDYHLHIWAFQGELDPVGDIDGFTDHLGSDHAFTGQRQLVRELIKQEIEPTPRCTWNSDIRHNSWIDAYSDPLLLDWRFSQSKN